MKTDMKQSIVQRIISNWSSDEHTLLQYARTICADPEENKLHTYLLVRVAVQRKLFMLLGYLVTHLKLLHTEWAFEVDPQQQFELVSYAWNVHAQPNIVWDPTASKWTTYTVAGRSYGTLTVNAFIARNQKTKFEEKLNSLEPHIFDYTVYFSSDNKHVKFERCYGGSYVLKEWIGESPGDVAHYLLEVHSERAVEVADEE